MNEIAPPPKKNLRIKETWLSKKPSPNALNIMLFQTLILFGVGTIFLTNTWNSQSFMEATPELVFQKKEYWRLWTALFAHADFGHLISNASLFVPLTFLLSGYFGIIIFPILGILLGGLINIIVLKTLPPTASLIGMSGVVYWMGAMWLTLFLLIDRRKSLKQRFAGVLFVAVVLFAPEAYKPQTSYLSHFMGFALGIVSALGFYFTKRKDFLKAEVQEEVIEEDEGEVLL